MAQTARALSNVTAGLSSLSLESAATVKSFCGLRATPVAFQRFGASGLKQNRQVWVVWCLTMLHFVKAIAVMPEGILWY